MNKKGQTAIVAILSIAFVMFTLMIMIIVVLPNQQFKKNECLQNIAKRYCEGETYVFDRLWNSQEGKVFVCFENERDVKGITFKFMDEELERCEK